MDLPRQRFTLSSASPMAPGPIPLGRLIPRLLTASPVSGPSRTTAAPTETPTAPAPLGRRLLLGR
jgi:hypothetical protein